MDLIQYKTDLNLQILSQQIEFWLDKIYTSVS